jgi:hypothetical protein
MEWGPAQLFSPARSGLPLATDDPSERQEEVRPLLLCLGRLGHKAFQLQQQWLFSASKMRPFLGPENKPQKVKPHCLASLFVVEICVPKTVSLLGPIRIHRPPLLQPTMRRRRRLKHGGLGPEMQGFPIGLWPKPDFEPAVTSMQGCEACGRRLAWWSNIFFGRVLRV